MSTDRPRPRVVRVLVNDMVSFVSLAAIVVTWVVYLLAANGIFLRSSLSETDAGDPVFLVIALVATAIFLPLLAWRIHYVFSVFKSGLLCTARITDIRFYRDRGRAEFAYAVGGKEIDTGSPIMKNAKTQALAVGEELDVVVHPEKLSRAFIVSLYT